MAASIRRRLSGSGNHSGGFQSRPQAIVCQGCGGQYFAASLPIHQKTCFERNPFVDIVCTECRDVVKSGRFRHHVDSCEGPSRATPTTQTARLAKPEAAPSELNAPDSDGRVRCRNCDRAFHADRIAKHQSVCAGTRRQHRRPPPTTVPSITKVTGDRRRVLSPPKTTSLPRRASYVTRIRGVAAVSMEFSGPSIASASPGMAWGRERDDKRFDLVHRDGARRLDSYGSATGAKLNVSMSTATSASNPLATTRLMTINSW